MNVWNVGAVSTGGTRQADRPTSTVRWGREASTDHSHEDGAGAVDAVLLTPQDPRTTRHRRVPATHEPATAPETAKHEGFGTTIIKRLIRRRGARPRDRA